MYLGLFEAVKDLREDAVLTEFYPYINKDEEVCVPDSKESGVIYGYENIPYDLKEREGVNPTEVLTSAEYLEELDEFLEEVNEAGRYKVELVTTKEELYKKYVTAVDVFDVYGIVNLIELGSNSTLVSWETIPEFKPPEGEYIPVDLATYTKSLIFLMPNIIPDLSVTIKMYNKYLKISKFKESNAVTNKFIIDSKDANDCIEELNDILADFNITPSDVVKVMEGEVSEGVLVDYYKEMMLEYDMSESQARGLLLHSLERTVDKYYKRNEMTEYQGTEQRILVSLETDEDCRNYASSSMI